MAGKLHPASSSHPALLENSASGEYLDQASATQKSYGSSIG